MKDASDRPTRLVDEIKDIFGDVYEDYQTPMLQELDPEAFAFIRHTVFAVMEAGDPDDGERVMNELATIAVWYFMIGREHAARGLPRPFGARDESIDDLIPDGALRDFIEDENI